MLLNFLNSIEMILVHFLDKKIIQIILDINTIQLVELV